MIILAIDAATSKSGLAVLVGEEVPKLVLAERFEQPSSMDVAERIYKLTLRVQELVTEFQPSVIVVEHLRFSKYAKNLDAMVKVAWAMGAVLVCLSPLGYRMDEGLKTVPANSVRKLFEVKNKAGLRRVVNKRFADDILELGFKKGLLAAHEDVSDAVGLAMWGWNQCKRGSAN
jgi:Holliday junction resolvasome RuvABC endonuclease subunit